MSVTYAYAAEIVKSERDANGDLLVYGKATGPDLDLDGQICDPSWLKSAMPAWMEWGNVREMHQPIAAGVGVELEPSATRGGSSRSASTSRPPKKIESRCAQGLQRRHQVTEGDQGRCSTGWPHRTDGHVVEVSYVDRPATRQPR
jgi:hypothetical protein